MVETRIVASPTFRHEVELTEAMRDGMRELSRQGEIAPLLASATSFWCRPPVAVAASVIAGLLAVTSLLLYKRLEQTQHELTDATYSLDKSKLTTPTSAETLLFQHTRSDDGTPDVIWRRAQAPTLIELRFDVGLKPAPSYTITIERLELGASAVILATPITGINVDGETVIAVHSALLEVGEYRVRLTPQAASTWENESIEYTLRILN